MDIEKNLVVSTANITQHDNELLEKASEDCIAGLTVYTTPYFHLVYLDKNVTTDILLKNGFSDAFVKLFAFANKADGMSLSYLKLDRDGDELEGFEIFNW